MHLSQALPLPGKCLAPIRLHKQRSTSCLAQNENVHFTLWESLQSRASWTASSLQALFKGGIGFERFVLCCIM